VLFFDRGSALCIVFIPEGCDRLYSVMEKSWKDAIIEVLAAASKAMHYANLPIQIVERGLRSELTATPAK
jgi:hypothetical protein